MYVDNEEEKEGEGTVPVQTLDTQTIDKQTLDTQSMYKECKPWTVQT